MTRILLLTTMLAVCVSAGPATQPGANTDNRQGTSPPVVIRSYDVHDLVRENVDYPLLPSMLPTLPAANEQTGITDTPTPTPLSSAERGNALIQLIKTTVDPSSWKDNGGTIGSLDIFDGRLVVASTDASQSEIQNLLTALSADAGRTVRVNAKWILLSPDEARALAPAMGKDAEAVTAIDDKTLDSSRLYCEGQTLGLSGQTVHVTCGQEQTYLSEATPVVETGVVAFQPTLSTVRSGVALQVTPTLSGKSVLLDLRSVVGNVGNIFGGPMPLAAQNDATTQPSAQSVVVQRPRIEAQQFHTTVRLPLGASVLVGGMSRVPGGDEQPTPSQLYLVVRVDAAH